MSAALQKNRYTMLFMMSDDANKFRIAGQTTSPAPNENPVTRTGRSGVYSIRNGRSCNRCGVVHNAAMRMRENTSAYTDFKRIKSTKILASLKIPVACFLAVYVLSATAAVAPSEQQKNAGAITEIRAVLRAQEEAWNRGDIDGFMKGYARSESTTFVSEDAVRRGWENVRERYLTKYSDRAKMGLLTFSDLEITLVSADAAVVLGHWKLKRTQDRPHGRFTLIFRKTADGWRIVHDHTSAAAPSQ
jgi:ketosteroid isomerase-like protein